jgi:hypothetical protein
VVLLGAGILSMRWSAAVGIPLVALSLFAFFEALRGWCVVRACGIRTRF